VINEFQRLDLAFLVHARHQPAFRRVEIASDNIGQLAVELGVTAELEGLQPMRLQPVLLPDAMDGARRQPDFFSQAPYALVSRGWACAESRGGSCIFNHGRLVGNIEL